MLSNGLVKLLEHKTDRKLVKHKHLYAMLCYFKIATEKVCYSCSSKITILGSLKNCADSNGKINAVSFKDSSKSNRNHSLGQAMNIMSISIVQIEKEQMRN